MPRAQPAERLPAGWNLSKPGGWSKYKEEGKQVANVIEMLAEDNSCGIEETMAKVEKIQDKMKYKAFGKTKPMTARKVEA